MAEHVIRIVINKYEYNIFHIIHKSASLKKFPNDENRFDGILNGKCAHMIGLLMKYFWFLHFWHKMPVNYIIYYLVRPGRHIRVFKLRELSLIN